MRAYSESNRGEYSRPVAKEAAVGPRAFARQPLRPFPPGRLRARVFSPPVAALLSSAAVSELRHTPSLTTEQPGNGSGPPAHMAHTSEHARKGREFSLAAHVFGFPASDNCYSPLEEPPWPWLDEFAANYADSDVFLGIFTSCRSGREWTLARAKTATIRMDMTAPYSLGVIVQPAAVSALIARQKQPTALILLCDGGCDCGHNVLSFFQRIHADPPHITQLSFLPAPYQQQAFQSKIRLKPTYSGYYGSPGYSDYESGYSDYESPEPDTKLPYVDEDALFEFIYPFLPQITHLDFSVSLLGSQGVRYEDAYEPPWRWLLGGRSPCDSLTHLTTAFQLDDWLIRLVASNAKALTNLSVTTVDPYLDDHSDRTWNVQELRVTSDDEWGAVRLRDLCKLPKSTHACVQVTGRAYMSIHTNEQGFAPPLALERMAEWKFIVPDIYIDPPPQPVSQHTSAVAVMQQLQLLPVVGATVILQKWQWDENMAQIVAGALPQLTHLQFGVAINGKLTDALLGILLQLGSRITVLDVGGLALQSDTHANTPWPWDELILGELRDMAQLLKLPSPRDRATPPTIECHAPTVIPCIQGGLQLRTALSRKPRNARNTFIPDTSAQVQTLESVAEWLTHVVLDLQTEVVVDCLPDETADMALLRTQLSVLRSVRLASTEAAQKASVSVNGLALTSTAMDVLRGSLPEWGGTLRLRDCTYPLPPSAYTQLAQSAPVSYQTWCLGKAAKAQVLESICAGLNERRAGLGLPPVTVKSEAHRSAERAIGEHVVLTVGFPQF